MSVTHDLRDILSSGGVLPAAQIFEGAFPSTPDTIIGLFQSGGPRSTHAMNAGPGTALVEYPHVQVRARDARPDHAQFLCEKAVRVLDALGRTINGVRYQAIWALQPPFFLQTDDSQRAEYAVNFEAVRVPATSS